MTASIKDLKLTNVSLLQEGDKIWFDGEVKGYTIQCRSENFLICTKPFNARKTVLYSVVDLAKELRGVDNYLGSLGYESKDECLRALVKFEDGSAEFSKRNKPIPLRVSKIKLIIEK